ncbi:RNA polymerase sigma factor (plasmid) [Bacillus velezensis]|uniref:RNA polymerase sigma factor n=1 Tax=Bacillus velezensis TaxID=492670 RepID=UPI0038D3BBB3
MIYDESYCRYKLEEFQAKHPRFCSHYLFKSFIRKPENRDILIKNILHPSDENKEALDRSFKKHHFHLKFLSYLSKTLHFNAVRFDQKRRQEINRSLLILDAPVKQHENNTLSFIERAHDCKQDIEKSLFQSSFIDEHFSDENLLKCFNTLTSIQKEVLTLYYLYSYTDSEIAKVQSKSQQSVFKTRKRALCRLRQQLKGVK